MTDTYSGSDEEWRETVLRAKMAMLWAIDPNKTPWREWTLEKCLAQIEEFERRTGRKVNSLRSDLGLPTI